MIGDMWRRATGRAQGGAQDAVPEKAPSRDDMRRAKHPRVLCPVCNCKVATTARSAEEVLVLMLEGKAIQLVQHAPCMHSEDDTREIPAPGAEGRPGRHA